MNRRSVVPILMAITGVCLQPAMASGPVRTMTNDAGAMFEWVSGSGDNNGLPFMIIDKRRAHLWVFDPSGQLQGDSPVLLGSARGDHTVPGVGDKRLSDVRPEERTTPAGRFVAEVGMNLRGEDVVWVDYDSGVSMHRVLTTNPKEQRARRLATARTDDNRVSYGCINVPKAFYENVVNPAVGGGNSVVYVLPESNSMQAVFGALAATGAAAARAR